MREEFLLIDLSSIAHPRWHTNASNPDPNGTSTAVVARIRALASDHPRTAICADSGRSFRRDVDPTYKAQRPTQEAGLYHQIDLAIERLRADGFPVWSVKGFEADDLIATAVARVLEIPEATALVASSDKDLLALVGSRCCAKSLRDGERIDEAAVLAKFGVRPVQMRDYLTLCGDASDNIKGANGIGPKKAAELLTTFVELDIAYMCIDDGTAKMKPATLASLQELRPRLETVRQLVTMRTDVPIPFEEILAERVLVNAPALFAMAADEEGEVEEPIDHANLIEVEVVGESVPVQERAEPATVAPLKPVAAVAVRKEESTAMSPVEWERQLEPRTMSQAMSLAENLFASRLFSAYGSAQGVLATILAGRELGMSATASLRAFHIIEGKPTLSADLLRALVINSGKAKFFRCTERTAERATFETQRGDDPPISLTYTIEEAKIAWPKDMEKFKLSGWGRNPADMCVARASSKLARLVFSDVITGLYASEEIDG